LRPALYDGTVLPMAAPEDHAHGDDAPRHDGPQKPHLRWTAAVLGAIAVLGLLAYRVWAGGAPPPEEEGSATAGTDPQSVAEPEDPVAAGLLAAEQALDRGLIEEAALRLEELREAHGDSGPAADLAQRIQLRLGAYRAALRPMAFRVESIETGLDAVFARVRLGGEVVHSSGLLVPSFSRASGARRANVFTLRTSFDRGVTLELVEPGGLISGPEVVFGPVEVSALPHLTGGIVEFEDPDAPVTNLVVRYTASLFQPGLTPDGAPRSINPGATPSELVRAVAGALDGAQLSEAAELLARLESKEPGHSDAAFLRQRLEDREVTLRRNLRTVRLVLLEVACDPAADGSPWSGDGSEPDFEVRAIADGENVAETDGGATAPFLVIEDNLAPPPGNVLEVTARGDATVELTVYDTSPTFSSTRVGSVTLPVVLAELPGGSGTLTMEREPSVLVLPASDPNRVRRVVLRYSVLD
jgi:hypothetical protein